jgi:hypothetical protein
MKNDLTTGAGQHDIGCPIKIVLVSTSDEYALFFQSFAKRDGKFMKKWSIQKYYLELLSQWPFLYLWEFLQEFYLDKILALSKVSEHLYLSDHSTPNGHKTIGWPQISNDKYLKLCNPALLRSPQFFTAIIPPNKNNQNAFPALW